MTSPVVVPTARPVYANDFYIFTAYSTVASQLLTEVLAGTGEDDPESVWTSSDGFAASYSAGSSSVSGAGTEASPYMFSVRPSGGWPLDILSHLNIYVVDETADSTPSIPAGWEDRSPYRDYDTLHVTTMAHLVANPTVRSDTRTQWPAVEAMVILTELGSTNLANYASIKANAALLSPTMHVFPAYRVARHHVPQVSTVGAGTFLFSDWVSPTYWIAMTALWRDIVIPLCDADDPRVYISAENYGVDSAEPTINSLVARGYTEQQFYDAIDPFVQLMRTTGRVCLVAPNGLGSGDDMHLMTKRLLTVLGVEWVQPVWEYVADYRIPNEYRESTGVLYPRDILGGVSQPALMDAALGLRCHHRRACSDDILREHGSLAVTYVVPSGAWGPLAPWIESVTDTDIASYGTAAMVNSTSLDSTNDMQYCWRLPPMYADQSPFSVGSLTSSSLTYFRSSVQTSLGSAGGGSAFDHITGWRLHPTAPMIYAAWRFAMLPTSATAWTALFRFRLPAGSLANVPLFGNSEVNIGLWQAYYDSSADAIKIKWSDGTISTVLATPPRDDGSSATTTRISIIVARASATSWRHAVYVNGVASAVTTVTTASIAQNRFVVFGGGQEVATFPTNNKIQSCVDFVGVELGAWHRTLTDVEIARHLAGQYPLGISRL